MSVLVLRMDKVGSAYTPRCRTWDLIRLKTALKKRELRFIEAGQVRTNPITPRKVETTSMSVPTRKLRIPQANTSSSSQQQIPVVHPTSHSIAGIQVPPTLNEQLLTYTTPINHQVQAPSTPRTIEHGTTMHLWSSAKGKENVQHDHTTPQQPNLTPPMTQGMWSPEHEVQVTDLKAKLVNAVSAAETWRLRHVEVEKTKALEETIKGLTTDSTTQ